jgi:hypothetical protein
MNDWLNLEFKHNQEDISASLGLSPTERDVVLATVKLVSEDAKNEKFSQVMEAFKNTMEFTQAMMVYGIVLITKARIAPAANPTIEAFIPGLGHVLGHVFQISDEIRKSRLDRPDGTDPMDDIINPKNEE